MYLKYINSIAFFFWKHAVLFYNSPPPIASKHLTVVRLDKEILDPAVRLENFLNLVNYNFHGFAYLFSSTNHLFHLPHILAVFSELIHSVQGWGAWPYAGFGLLKV